MRKPTFWLPTWTDTNQAVQLQKMARDLKFRIKKVEGLYYVAETKALISFVVTAKLICVFVFACMQNVGFLMTWLNYWFWLDITFRECETLFPIHCRLPTL